VKSALIGLSALALALAVAAPSQAAPSQAAPSQAAPSQAAPSQAGASAAPPPSAVAPPYDPFEGANRAMFGINKAFDRAVLRPVALGYKRVLPAPVRKGVDNALNNLGEPMTAINDVLQAKPSLASDAAGRFLLNSTLGLLGVFDIAGMEGKPIHYSDFGQTLGRYGVQPGPFIYLPILGPSNFRDGLGRIVDAFGSPLNLHVLHVTTAEHVGEFALDGINTRANFDELLEDLRRSATDEYAAQRSVYMQSRQAKIADTHTAIQALPDFDAPSDAGAPQPKH
jgi:phospholipid-binding lipoprotein MlaA